MRYYFDTHNGGRSIDNEGLEFASEDEAINEAKEMLASISPEAIIKGQNLVSIVIRSGERVIGTFAMSIDVRRSG